jgi:predicted ester cyclase
MSESDNLELYRRVTLGAFAGGDMGIIDELLTPDFTEHEPAPGVRPGREGVKDLVNMMRAAFPDLHIRIDDSFGAGDQLCARSTWTGTNTGSFMGNPPTGRSATWEAIDIIRVQDGRCAEHWGQLDIMGLLTQLGLMQMPKAA